MIKTCFCSAVVAVCTLICSCIRSSLLPRPAPRASPPPPPPLVFFAPSLLTSSTSKSSTLLRETASTNSDGRSSLPANQRTGEGRCEERVAGNGQEGVEFLPRNSHREQLRVCAHREFSCWPREKTSPQLSRLSVLRPASGCLASTTRECTTATASEEERGPVRMKADRRGPTSRSGSVSSSASSEWGPTGPGSLINTGERVDHDRSRTVWRWLWWGGAETYQLCRNTKEVGACNLRACGWASWTDADIKGTFREFSI